MHDDRHAAFTCYCASRSSNDCFLLCRAGYRWNTSFRGSHSQLWRNRDSHAFNCFDFGYSGNRTTKDDDRIARSRVQPSSTSASLHFSHLVSPPSTKKLI